MILSRTPGAVLLNGAEMVQEGDVTQAANDSARVRLAVGVGTGTVTASFDTATTSTVLGNDGPRAFGGNLPTRPDRHQPRGHLDGGTVTLPTNTISGGGDYTLLVSDGPAAGTAIATLLADDNARSTNTTRPVKMRLVHGATTANPIALSVGSDFIGGVLPRHRLALRPDRGERLDRDQGRDHQRRRDSPLHQPRDLERDAHRLLGLRPGHPCRRQARSGPASFAPTADRKPGGVIPGFHCPLEEAAALPTIAPPRSNRPADPVPVTNRAPGPADHD